MPSRKKRKVLQQGGFVLLAIYLVYYFTLQFHLNESMMGAVPNPKNLQAIEPHYSEKDTDPVIKTLKESLNNAPTATGDNKKDPVVEVDLSSFPGARDEKGEMGYVADASTNHLLVTNTNKEDVQSIGCSQDLSMIEETGGNQVLQKIELSSIPKSSPRILCLIYTQSGATANLRSIVNTWAKECDGFVAASNITLPDLGSIDLVHDGPESYDNMWQKVRSIWVYAYQNYLDQFDYFHM